MKKFIVALFACAEVFREPMTEERAKLYCSLLGHYGEDELVRAAFVLMRGNARFPMPKDFIGVLEGEGADVEAEATATFGRLAASNFARKDIEALAKIDPCVRAAVDACGGDWLLREGDEGFQWKRKAFVAAYKGARQREVRDRDMNSLPPLGSEVRKLIDRVAGSLPAPTTKSGGKSDDQQAQDEAQARRGSAAGGPGAGPAAQDRRHDRDGDAAPARRSVRPRAAQDR